jgi:hypothetical protein
VNRGTSTPYTLSQKNLTWVLSTNKQILQRQILFEPLFNNKAPLTKKRGLIKLTSHKKFSKICKFNRQAFKNYFKKTEKKTTTESTQYKLTSEEKLCRFRLAGIGGKT